MTEEKPEMRIGVSMINDMNIGYLPAIVLKEIKAGRKCEIVGGLCRDVNTMDDYRRLRERMQGKFAEIIGWKKDRTAQIATRNMPKWAIDALEKALETCPEMERWLM